MLLGFIFVSNAKTFKHL